MFDAIAETNKLVAQLGLTTKQLDFLATRPILRPTFEPMLYSPATLDLDKLGWLASGGNPFVRMLVLCTEDAIPEDDLPKAKRNIKRLLSLMDPASPVSSYIRVRNTRVLKSILRMPDIDKIRGVVVPKVTAKSLELYAAPIVEHGGQFEMVLIVEHRSMGEHGARTDLLRAALRYRDRVLMIRPGGADLSGNFEMRRDKWGTRPEAGTIWGNPVMSALLATISLEFRTGLDDSGGFAISGCVFDGFGGTDPSRYDAMAPGDRAARIAMDELERQRLATETEIDVSVGHLAKTIIHPQQFPVVFREYSVPRLQYDEARRLLETDAAVASHNGRMNERGPFVPNAQSVVDRACQFGIREDLWND